MRSVITIVAGFGLLLTACSDRPTATSQQARVRNQPPATCTQDDFNRCPAPLVTTCEGGAEPVIDYSSDCCPHFSCQPICVASVECPMRPAPTCPVGTRLWIGTALEDCCPAYRCEPDFECESLAGAACAASLPYCGPGVEPIIVGHSEDCCPIYQCPCETDEGEAFADQRYCGCTYPACGPGEQLLCLGDDACGYPCECVPINGNCLVDEDCFYDCTLGGDCGMTMWCDTSACLPDPDCDLNDPSMPCADVCYGVCVGGIDVGCRNDYECPVGQRCEMMCMGFSCIPDPTFPPCECPPEFSNCICDETGACYGEQCSGQCIPLEPFCDEVCPASPCPDGYITGTDECGCPIYECGNCSVPPGGATCPLNACYCGIQVGTDESCCPIYWCPDVEPPEPCPQAVPPPCGSDAECGTGGICVNGICGTVAP